jgi:hypothetical protein
MKSLIEQQKQQHKTCISQTGVKCPHHQVAQLFAFPPALKLRQPNTRKPRGASCV